MRTIAYQLWYQAVPPSVSCSRQVAALRTPISLGLTVDIYLPGVINSETSPGAPSCLSGRRCSAGFCRSIIGVMVMTCDETSRRQMASQQLKKDIVLLLRGSGEGHSTLELIKNVQCGAT